eukprot:TRINITY_DN5925_c0_g1_i6.p1 TRINITY_DN5925_c0_g1~~TRINITY_DN5925_c0_g1_i6.p1  ORF type:complete len:1042 (+),score=224.08 TRINITY_DN5925_c0_g1_i6:721-3846(+)
MHPAPAPSAAPSPLPSAAPTRGPLTSAPTAAPLTALPSRAPSPAPTAAPSPAPTGAPSSAAPSAAPTLAPLTAAPSRHPSGAPTTAAPSAAPSLPPVPAPSGSPSPAPTGSPASSAPSVPPSLAPVLPPTGAPSPQPTAIPTASAPSAHPTQAPVPSPTGVPSLPPSVSPSASAPSVPPTQGPSRPPSAPPSPGPSVRPSTAAPSRGPSLGPTAPPTRVPSRRPTEPPLPPSRAPSAPPSAAPSASIPTAAPSAPPQTPTASPFSLVTVQLVWGNRLGPGPVRSEGGAVAALRIAGSQWQPSPGVAFGCPGCAIQLRVEPADEPYGAASQPRGFVRAALDSQDPALLLLSFGPPPDESEGYTPRRHEAVRITVTPRATTMSASAVLRTVPKEGLSVVIEHGELPITESERGVVSKTVAGAAAVDFNQGASATQSGKVSMLLRLMECPSGLTDENMHWTEAPLGLVLNVSGDTRFPGRLGAVVGNTIVVCGISLAHFAAAGAIYCWKRYLKNAHASLIGSFGLARFPSYSFFPGLFLFQSTLQNALTVLWYDPSHPAKLVATAAALCSCGGTTGVVLWCTADCNFRGVYYQEELDPRGTCIGRLYQRVYLYVMGPGDYWSPKDRSFIWRYGLMFQDYREGFHRTMRFEVLFITALAAVDAFNADSVDLCRAQLLTTLVIYFIYTASMAYLCPFHGRMNSHAGVFFAACQTAVVACVSAHMLGASPLDPGGTLLQAASVVLLVSVMLLSIKAIIDLLTVVIDNFEHLRDRQTRGERLQSADARHRQESREAPLNADPMPPRRGSGRDGARRDSQRPAMSRSPSAEESFSLGMVPRFDTSGKPSSGLANSVPLPDTPRGAQRPASTRRASLCTAAVNGSLSLQSAPGLGAQSSWSGSGVLGGQRTSLLASQQQPVRSARRRFTTTVSPAAAPLSEQPVRRSARPRPLGTSTAAGEDPKTPLARGPWRPASGRGSAVSPTLAAAPTGAPSAFAQALQQPGQRDSLRSAAPQRRSARRLSRSAVPRTQMQPDTPAGRSSVRTGGSA